MIEQVKLVVDESVRTLCRKPYLGHPKGCPNFGKKRSCPPNAPLIGKLLDLNEPVWAVWVDFDLGAHRDRMWRKHPKWSPRQAECCLYWQATVNNQLQDHVLSLFTTGSFAAYHGPMKTVFCPEACGVNITATMESAGVFLEWPPVETVRKIALVGNRPRQGVK